MEFVEETPGKGTERDFDKLRTLYSHRAELLHAAFRERLQPVSLDIASAVSQQPSEKRDPKCLRKVAAQDLTTYILGLNQLRTEWAAFQPPDDFSFELVADCKSLYVQDEVQLPEVFFLIGLDFSSSHFERLLNFDGSTFSRDVRLGSVEIAHASFNEAKFLDGITGDGSKFGDVEFYWATISGRTSLQQVTFICAGFKGVVFDGEAEFRDSKFKQTAHFSMAKFAYEANFDDVIFYGMAWFDESRFSVFSLFNEAVFMGSASFDRAVFEHDAIFEHCRFYGAPGFHDAKLPQNTSFYRAKFLPQMRGRWTNDDRQRFRTLKLLMGSLRAQQDEALFFSLEMRVQRLVEYKPYVGYRPPDNPRRSAGPPISLGHPFLWFISWFYDVVSRYGQSPGRAFWAFMIWNTVFTAIYFFLSREWPDEWGERVCAIISCLAVSGGISVSGTASISAFADVPSIALTLQNVFNPLAILSEKSLVIVSSKLVMILSLLQIIGSLAMLTLMLLSLRGRFQKGGGGSG
jgi:hypothetical protein